MSEKTRKRESLGGRRGGSAQRLHETAALDPRDLDPKSTRTKGGDQGPLKGSDDSQQEPTEPTSPGGHENGGGAIDPPGTGQSGDGPSPGASGPAVDSPPPRPPRPRSDFRDALQIQPWTTSQDLWDRYAGLALEVRKDTGQRVAIAELIRVVLEENLPDPTTRSGVSALAGYADRWTSLRARTKTTQKAQNVRLPRRVVEGLEQAQVSLLEDRGTNVAIGRMISGVVNEHFPSEAEAKRLLGIR